MLILGLALLIGAFLCSAALGSAMRRISPRIGLVCRPGEHRQHGREVPLGGGLAMLATIALAMLGGAVVIYLVAPWRGDWLPAALVNDPRILEGLRWKMPGGLVMLAGAAAVCALGLIDDYRPLGPIVKLIVEFVIVGAVVGSLLAMFQEIHAAEFLPAPASAAVSVVWIVLMINSVNFLDNMDGLSASVVILCGSFLVAAGAINGQFFVPGLMLVVIGSAGGFLLHNFPPARLFMGDSGSLVLGYFVGLLSVLTVFTTDAAHQQAAVLMPLVMMAIPLYDTATVILVRVTRRAELLKGDRNHFSHRLAARGMSVRAVLAAICLANCATGLAGVFLMQLPPHLAWVVFAQTLCVLGVIGLVEWHWAASDAPGASRRNDKSK